MNACGQIMLGRNITQLPSSLVMRGFYDDFGGQDLFEVAGIIEFLENEIPEGASLIYAFSPEAQRFASVSRLNARFDTLDMGSIEEDRKQNVEKIKSLIPEQDDYSETFIRMAASTEAPFCMVLKMSESDVPASREGWVRRVVRGTLLQREEPNLFQGIFYELSFDVEGQAIMLMPTASERHYAYELSEIGCDDALSRPIWGYARNPEQAVYEGEKNDA